MRVLTNDVHRIALAICEGRTTDAREALFFGQGLVRRSAFEVALLVIDVADELFVREGESTRSWAYAEQLKRVRDVLAPTFKGRVEHGKSMVTDDRFGFVGDNHSGTLLCQWPGCGAEIYTESWKSDKAADEHWKSHTP